MIDSGLRERIHATDRDLLWRRELYRRPSLAKRVLLKGGRILSTGVVLKVRLDIGRPWR